MPVSTTNLIQGPAVLYIAAFGSTEPTDANLNTAPSTPWRDVGGTDGGLTITTTETIDPLSVDQVLEIPGDVITARNTTVATSMAEVTLANMAAAWNFDETDTTNTLVAGTSPVGTVFQPGAEVVNFKPIYHALIVDGLAPGGFRRRIIIRRAIQTGAVGSAYQKAGQTLLPVTFRSTYVSSTIRPIKIIDGIA